MMQLASAPQVSVRPRRASKSTPPAFLATAPCPACGRHSAIVFQVFRSVNGRAVEPRPVCLACCPKVAGDS